MSMICTSFELLLEHIQSRYITNLPLEIFTGIVKDTKIKDEGILRIVTFILIIITGETVLFC